jgi:ADP-ribosyl-[dinitrogen reductase] hydrolase
MNNTLLLNQFFEKNEIRIRRSEIFTRPVLPKPMDFDFDKIEGMLLGLVIGDALGITTEGILPQKRNEIYGEVRDYIPNRYVDEAKGFPSDDTQLAFWTLEQMLSDNGFAPERVAARFCQRKIFGIGATVRQFILNFKSGIAWHKCGPESAGNGALMRIAPMVVPYLKSNDPGLWVDTALSAMITHNDTASIAACVSFVNIIWQVLDMREPPQPTWWLEQYVKTARDLELEHNYRPRGGAFLDYSGPVWKYVEEKVSDAHRQQLRVVDACNLWHSGAYLMETIPSVIYILMYHGDDFEEAVVRAVNDTKDNDTIAAIVGAVLGALHGKAAIPRRWIDNLSGRTTDSDDGRVFELIREARKQFWESTANRHQTGAPVKKPSTA